MDFLDPAKKRAHQKRLFLGYFLIGVAILLGSLILVLLSYGFDVDRRTGQVIQNGLIFTASAPESAKIYLNGKDSGNTDKKLTVPAGEYNLELKRDGYRTWKRSFNLEGSSIERLVYPVLFPVKMNTKDQQVYSATPAFSTQSLDRRWIITAQPNSFTNFELFDANNPKDPLVPFSIPATLLTTPTGVPQTLTLVEWSSDNRHVLLKHSYGESYEFIMLDREVPASSVNVNKLLSITPTAVTLRDKKFDKLYLYDTKTQILQTADTKSKEIKPYLKGVISYKSHGDDKMLYVSVDPEGVEKTIVRLRDNDKTYTLRRGLKDEAYLLDMARFDGHWYVTVASVNNGRVYIYRDPASQQPADSKALPSLFTTLVITSPTQVAFSANTRFIMTQSGSKFAVYDAETNRRYYYTSDLNLPAESKATWMDGHRLLVNHDSKVVVFDYDGINKQTLVPIVPGTLPFFDRDYTRLFTLGTSVGDPSKTALTRTDMKLNLAL